MKTFGLFASFVFGVLLLVPDARAQESPLQVEGATTVDAAAAKALFDRAVPFVDVRTNDLWEAGHIPGAVFQNLFVDFNEGNLLKVATKDQEVVIYCDGGQANGHQDDGDRRL